MTRCNLDGRLLVCTSSLGPRAPRKHSKQIAKEFKLDYLGIESQLTDCIHSGGLVGVVYNVYIHRRLRCWRLS